VLVIGRVQWETRCYRVLGKNLREPQNHPVATKAEIDFLRLLSATEDGSSDYSSLDNEREGRASFDEYNTHVWPDDALYN
jgi:hypothetical protein